jgi:uncharacterized damage-inducible protein DinB
MDRGLNLSSIAGRVPVSIPLHFKRIVTDGETIMKLTELFLGELEREGASTRHALERVPEGHNDWKPHPKSMPLGRLAGLVATMPTWIVVMVKQDQLDLRTPAAAKFKPLEWRTRGDLIAALDAGVAEAREALSNTTDEHLLTPWRFVVGGQVVDENPRHIMIRDSVFSHLAHHRGQLTVYLRLNEASVPAVYCPYADEGTLRRAHDKKQFIQIVDTLLGTSLPVAPMNLALGVLPGKTLQRTPLQMRGSA